MDKLLEQTIIKNARSWINTPWRHNYSSKGIGVDCVRFLEAVAKESGLNLEPLPEHYNRRVMNDSIRDYLDRNFVPVTRDKIKPCDILLFNIKGFNHHIGIGSYDGWFIHANERANRVMEQPLNGIWEAMVSNGGVWEIS